MVYIAILCVQLTEDFDGNIPQVFLESVFLNVLNILQVYFTIVYLYLCMFAWVSIYVCLDVYIYEYAGLCLRAYVHNFVRFCVICIKLFKESLKCQIHRV